MKKCLYCKGTGIYNYGKTYGNFACPKCEEKKKLKKCYYCKRNFKPSEMGIYKGERICIRCERNR